VLEDLGVHLALLRLGLGDVVVQPLADDEGPLNGVPGPAEGGVGSTLNPAELSLEVEHVTPRSTLTIEPLSVTILLSDVAFQPES